MQIYDPLAMRHSTITRHLPYLLLILALTTAAVGGAQCGDKSPFTPVPQTFNNVTLWPGGLQPARPGQTLPANRDSSSYLSQTIPGANSGHELFLDIDIVANHAYIAYNAGLQIWNLGGSYADNPALIVARDGWNGDFETFPPGGEVDTYVEAVTAHADGNDVLITLSGRSTVGPSFWRHSANGSLARIAQDATRSSRDVAMAAHGGKVYSFSADSDHGVTAYVSSTGQYLGSLADEISVMRHVQALSRGGKLWIAGSSAAFAPMRIWQWVPGAVSPDPSLAIQRYDGASLGFGVRDLAFFEHGGVAYLALVQSQQIKIFNVDACLDNNGCTTLGNPVWSTSLSGTTPNEQFLTFSMAGSTPYLYYGFTANSSSGTKRERLFNLQNLGGSNQIPEITEGGGVYTDACGNQVDYWGYYHDGNQHGFRNHSPRAGHFNGSYFYRVGRAAFDVHALSSAGTDPVVSTAVASAPPHWMSTTGFSHAINLSATQQNCAGSGWQWFEDDTLSSVSGTGSTAVLTAEVCGPDAGCPNRVVEAWADKSDCSGDPKLLINRATVTVQDPRVTLAGLNVSPPGSEFPRGTTLQWTADLNGRAPFTYAWEARRASGVVLATSTAATFVLDTSGVEIDLCGGDPACVFKNGFETGDLQSWSFTVSPAPGAARAPSGLETKGVASETITVELTVQNLSGTVEAVGSTTITLSTLQFVDVTGFTINSGASPGCGFQPLAQRWECSSSQPITFTVTADGTPTSFEFDWDGNGTFEESIPAGNPITHTYGAGTGAVTPAVRGVVGGSISAPLNLELNLSIF